MITSLLDNDFYQFTMSQYAWKYEKTKTVRYEFRNRSFAVPLGNRISIPELNLAFKYIQQLSFTEKEIQYLFQLEYFDKEYIQDLTQMKLCEVNVSSNNGHLVIEYEDIWWKAMFWETIILSIVNEFYFDDFDTKYSEGEKRLLEKRDYLLSYPGIYFSEFGTRRRFSHSWQWRVYDFLMEELPEQVVGTSNTLLAMQYEQRPIGTMAHQIFMVTTASQYRESNPYTIKDATNMVLRQWRSMYGKHPELMILLPDTYTTPVFMDAIPSYTIDDYPAMRQDSADPIKIGDMWIDYIKSLKKDPKEKLIIFSDSLNMRTMSLLWERYHKQINVGFGWGTNLTNDLGYETLSTIIKPKSVMGIPCVKISDDLQKATGDSQSINKYLEMIAKSK